MVDRVGSVGEVPEDGRGGGFAVADIIEVVGRAEGWDFDFAG